LRHKALQGKHLALTRPPKFSSTYVQGGDIVKVFPAPGAGYIKDLLAPLRKFTNATGGINLQSIKVFSGQEPLRLALVSALVIQNSCHGNVFEGHFRKSKGQQ